MSWLEIVAGIQIIVLTAVILTKTRCLHTFAWYRNFTHQPFIRQVGTIYCRIHNGCLNCLHFPVKPVEVIKDVVEEDEEEEEEDVSKYVDLN